MPFLLRYIKNLAVAFLLLILFFALIFIAGCFIVWQIPRFNIDPASFPIFRLLIIFLFLIVFFLTLDKKI